MRGADKGLGPQASIINTAPIWVSACGRDPHGGGGSKNTA